jgi:hypothetical protein
VDFLSRWHKHNLAVMEFGMALRRIGQLLELCEGHQLGFDAHGQRLPSSIIAFASVARTNIRGGGLLFLFLYLDGLEVFRLEDLPAIQTFQVVDSVSPSDDLGADVVASDLHD